MFWRRPYILWRMLLGQCWRLAALTAGVLVTIMAFAAAVKPLSDGLLDPGSALKFMVLAAAPMLQFALPFASGFAATLAYHRFASENEATAAYAGGVGHRSVLFPALFTGFLLSLALGALVHVLIPGYFRSMQRLVAQDASRVIVASVESGRPLRLPGGLLVHADSVNRPPRANAGGAQDHLTLGGVVAVRTGKDGAVESEATAQRAGVWLYPDGTPGGGTLVVVRLLNASGSMVVGRSQGSNRDTEFRLHVPGAFQENPKFYTTRAFAGVLERPEVIDGVEARRRTLAALLAGAEEEREILLAARSDGRLALADPDGQTVVLRASDLRREGGRWRLLASKEEKPIEIAWRLTGDRARLQSAARAWLEVDGGDAPGASGAPDAMRITLTLEDVATTDAAAETGAPTVRTRQTVGPLRRVGAERAARDAASETSAALLASVGGAQAGDERINKAASDLRREIDDLRREILSKTHERWAATFSCLAMTLAGAVVALRHRDARPLLLYIWSFFPSLLAVIAIAGGQNLTHRVGASGLALLYAGVVGLLLFTGVEYARLRRR